MPVSPRYRLRLDANAYGALRNKILRRDGWRCQYCGTMANLEVHHKQFRSHLGEDCEENLITTCFRCHSYLHRRAQDETLTQQQIG